MKKYNIPVSWIQQGLLQVEASDLTDAVDKVESLDLAPMNLVGQTAPNSTRVAYSIINSYVQDEVLSKGITMYTRSDMPQCPFCDKARTWLSANEMEYTEVDVMLDEKHQKKVFDRTGTMNMPQFEIGNEIIVGFTEPEFKMICQKYGIIEPEPAPAPVNGPPAEFLAEQDKKAKVVKLDKEEKSKV